MNRDSMYVVEDLFKFHYVSINSDRYYIKAEAVLWDLNSIMFLLILILQWWERRLIRNLNSIMFLLIHKEIVIQITIAYQFKFHYVSINSGIHSSSKQTQIHLNSIMFLLIHLLHLHENLIGNKFKFHYVSINSNRCPYMNRTSLKYLNSIMFLLIQNGKRTSSRWLFI